MGITLVDPSGRCLMCLRSWKLNVLAIYASVSKKLVLERLEAGHITGCGPSVPELTTDEVNKTPRIVAQMGPEPFLQAMQTNPDFNVVIGGRAYDPSPYVAYCAYIAMGTNNAHIRTLKLGPFTHMGKIMECGGLCATPKSGGAIASINKDQSFDIKPLDPAARCIPLSIAAHTLYEKSRPDILHGPGGYLDLREATYKQLPDGVSVRVKGSIFTTLQKEKSDYTVKLEGAKVSGYRTLILGSFRDPILIPQIPAFLETVKDYVRAQHTDHSEPWDIYFHVYGLDASTQTLTRPARIPREVFIVGEVMAESQALATSLASSARVACAHGPYPGQKATSGNFAMGIGGGFELEMAECAEFSVYHLMDLWAGEDGAVDDATRDEFPNIIHPELFTWKFLTIGTGTRSSPADIFTLSATAPRTKLPLPAPSSDSSHPTSDSPPRKPPHTLVDIAQIIRSKNAGPYEITMDVIFSDPVVYALVKASNLLSPALIADLYELPEEEIVWCGFFDVALAFKATIARKRNGKAACSGGFAEDDVHGSQQYVRLMEVILPKGLVKDLVDYWRGGVDN